MNIKQKALVETAKFVGSILLGAAALVGISALFGEVFVMWLLIAGLFGFSAWMMYSVNLSKLQWEERDREREQRKDPKMD
jgi:fatty acid desaturase